MDITEVLAPVRDLGAFIREQRESAQISLRQLAKQAGVSNPYLSQVERGLRRPSADILAQIAHGLQISVESLLTMAGILDEPSPDAVRPIGVEAAIGADPVLTDRQKESLREIYRLYRRESERRADAGPPADPGRPVAVPAAHPPAAPVPPAEPEPTPPPAPLPGVHHEGVPDVVPH